MTHLRWKNFIDNRRGVVGVALIHRGYDAPLHRHHVDESYFLIYGVAHMWHNGKIIIIKAPSYIRINSGNLHALTPITSYAVLIYTFTRGPFESIKYEYPEEIPLLSRL